MRTTPSQRHEFYECHQRGQTYAEIAARFGRSKECVRYWCRRQRDGGGCETSYHRQPAGLLSRFDARVRYCILRLRLEHRRWGPNRILARLRKRPSLRGLRLPSEASIGRYLHQWPRFRRPSKTPPSVRQRPQQPTAVHQRWQLDFKVQIVLAGETRVDLHTIRDPVGEACIRAQIFPAGHAGDPMTRVQLEQVRAVIRTGFAYWRTLPREVQTDGETVLVGRSDAESFPSTFTLWLKGLGIDHLVIRAGKPTDNAEVERCHRTIYDYVIVGNEDASPAQLQVLLDEALYELAYELPSQAEGCAGRPPVVAHPELLQPPRPFQPEHELALFDLRRVDEYLATFTWKRMVGKTGQVCIGERRRYSIGRRYARQEVLVRFDLTDRHFVFYAAHDPERELARRPARGLEVADLTGITQWPVGPGPQQLPLPLIMSEG